MENNTSNTQTTTAAEYRAEAARHEQDAIDSFDRCDTDGFLSQWASGICAQKARLAAQIAENGGMAEFPALFDLEGRRVPAKLIQVADRFRYGQRSVWALIDPVNPEGRFLGFVNPSTGGKRSIANLRDKGYVEGYEMAPARADIVGTGHGLSGSAWAATVRTDRGW